MIFVSIQTLENDHKNSCLGQEEYSAQIKITIITQEIRYDLKSTHTDPFGSKNII